MSVVASRQVACASCGAILEYRPDGGEAVLTCSRCGAKQPIREQAAAPKEDWRELVKAAHAAGQFAESGVLDCGTCGAQTTLAPSVIADRCPFCGQPSVNPAQSRLLRPAAILPFTLDEKQARAAVVGWERDLWWKPSHRLGPDGGAWKMSAVYLPYWTFDWDVETEYHGRRGIKVDKETRWTDVSGTVRTRLDGATVFGSKSVGREQGAELEPWDTDRVVAYQDAYLLGVRAETSAISVPEAGSLAHRVLERQVTYEIECDIGGDSQVVSDKTIRYHAASVQLLLMPVWVTHFEHGGESHRVLVNARTGEVIGERPISRPRLYAAMMVPLAVAIAGAVAGPLLFPAPLPAWRAHLAGFWGTVLALGVLTFIVGSVMSGRAKGGGPSRHKQLYVTRRGPGSTGLQVDPAAVWHGALQDDPESRGALVQLLGFAGLFVSMFPFLTTVGFDDTLMPLVMMHGFGLLSLGLFVWATRASRRDRRKLLELD